MNSVVMLAVVAMSLAAQAQQPPAAGAAPAPARGPGGGLVQLLVESKAFEDGGVAPLKYSFYGSNTQPDFRLSNVPATAQTFAIIFHDLDVAAGNNPEDNLHWVAWNSPAVAPVTQIEEGRLPEGAVHGRDGRTYMGMGAPNGPRYHHYVFEFYALNAKLDLPASAGRAELWQAMQGKVVAKAAYVTRFRNDTNAPRPPTAAPPRGQ
jgi:Raf kinase inhibitor-like YbhB/YbcL family protein